MKISILVLLQVAVTSCVVCPPWTLPYTHAADNTTHCKCGDTYREIITCDKDTLQVSILACITYNMELNKTLVGPCFAQCFKNTSQSPDGFHYLLHTNNSEAINDEVCGRFNRTGQLCGRCIEGHGPPVYSYVFQCVKCNETDFKYNLLKYTAVAFLPLTGFYLIVIAFKIRATAGFMVAFVMISQLATSPFEARRRFPQQDLNFNIAVIFFAIWNLDILRSVYSPFCIHPDMTTLQVLALDYLVGVYPLVLIALTYFVVMLHDRYPLIVRIWRPVNALCRCIRREWNIRGSLLQAFSTFLVLSYVKILSVSFDILTPVSLLTPESGYLNETYLYSAGEIPYFGRELPSSVLSTA